ncbi:MAG: hypothetical protein LBP67_07880 [Bacteroidales bacterium]|nr:hypothetical protein [Bacteroidales bacterium]
MKKNLILSIVLLVFATTVSAQSLNEAGELFNTANEQFKSKNFNGALKSYQNALSIANQLGEDGKDLAGKIEKMIPTTKVNYGKELIQNKNIDEALKYLLEAVDDAEKLGETKIANSSKSLISNVYVSQAGSAFGQKNWEETIKLSDLAIKYNVATPKAYLFNALSYSELNNEDKMVESITKAVSYGNAKNDEKTVNSAKQVGTTYFNNQAQELIAKNKFNEAIDALNKSISIDGGIETTWYLKASCFNKLNKSDEAIEAGLMGLETESDSKDIRNGINLELARAYEAKGDKDNACKYYSQAATSATFKEEATHKMTEVLKCN